MQINLDKNKTYDLSELTSKELNQLLNYMNKNHGWMDNDIHTDLFYKEGVGWMYNKFKKVSNMTNAKELFYTLENIQVDCRELSEEQIREMADVFNTNGFETWDNIKALDKKSSSYLRIGLGGEVFLNHEIPNKTTITYSKFMELFGNKSEPKRWYKSDFGTKFLVYAEEMKGAVITKGYGFDDNGKWCNEVPKVIVTVLATKEEVEERLTQEAIKRGFNVGYESGKYVYFTHDKDWYYNDKSKTFFVRQKNDTWNTIMKDGVWLESKLPPYKESPLKWNYETLVGDVIETTDEVTPISLFSSREKRLKKTLKYLLKKDIILTPKQYKKLWKK